MSTTSNNSSTNALPTYVPQVDYTSRDYTSIVQDMVTLIPTYAPNWTNRDPSDFGIMLIQIFGWLGDQLNYYIDRSANEAFITTASQRDSVLKIATLLGYVPTNATASSVTLTFQNSTDSAIIVPALTQVATSTISNATTSQIIFETVAEITVPPISNNINGSATVIANQGITVTNELIGIATGFGNQVFQLSQSPVINNTISISINNVTYTQVNYLIDANSYDPVFSATTDANNVTFITFGDGVSGQIPPSSTNVYATYRVGGGADGNVASGSIEYILTNAVPGLTVLNQDISVSGDGAATGGSNPESTDSIRLSAPKSVRSLNRAVSITDYSDLVQQISGISQAVATASVFTSVTVYFAPAGDKGVLGDGVTPSGVFNNLATTAYNYLVNKAPANTTITFQPPSYVPVDISVSFTVLPQYNRLQVESQVNQAISMLLAFDNVIFNDTIRVSDVLKTVTDVAGVAFAQVTNLLRHDLAQKYTITNKALTANVATLTTSVDHFLNPGDTVYVHGIGTPFDGTYIVLTTPTTNTFTYSNIAINVTSTTATGFAEYQNVQDILCALNEIPELITTPTLNVSGGIVV